MRVRNVIPVLDCSDLPAAVAEFRDAFGFTVDFVWEGPPAYAGLERDDVEIHLRAVEHSPSIGRLSLIVEDIDAINADLVARGATITVPLDEREYGMRDLAVVTLDGHTIAFGA